jgi:ATP synthase protein I
MARSRRASQPLWRHLVHVGVLGWVFVLPVVLGAVLGRMLEHWTGRRGAALAALLLGVLVGMYAAWRELSGGLWGDPNHDGEESER